MEKSQFEEIKRLLEHGNSLAEERLSMEKELFEARRFSLQASNKHIDAAGKLTRGALKIQPFAMFMLIVLCLLITYMVIFKI